MPALTVDGRTNQVDEGERLVIATEELGINIGHRCQAASAVTASNNRHPENVAVSYQ